MISGLGRRFSQHYGDLHKSYARRASYMSYSDNNFPICRLSCAGAPWFCLDPGGWRYTNHWLTYFI